MGKLVLPKMNIKNKKQNNGFTLVELMVATFIFTAIMLASMGALLITMDSARKARGLRTAMDNINFTMESMTRSIRMGTNYVCVEGGGEVPGTGYLDPKDCEAGTLLSFVPQKADPKDPERISYKWDVDNHTLQRCESSDCVEIVAPEVSIDKLNFFVRGSSLSDEVQANVYVIIKGQVIIKGVATSFAIQTMASQRNF
ncbi:MAG: type II secretion system protein [Candidatus Paceibacterota bacterium]|jgi:prepilin-type N-terminal cleavage/methylation domain-containing protein